MTYFPKHTAMRKKISDIMQKNVAKSAELAIPLNCSAITVIPNAPRKLKYMMKLPSKDINCYGTK